MAIDALRRQLSSAQTAQRNYDDLGTFSGITAVALTALRFKNGSGRALIGAAVVSVGTAMWAKFSATSQARRIKDLETQIRTASDKKTTPPPPPKKTDPTPPKETVKTHSDLLLEQLGDKTDPIPYTKAMHDLGFLWNTSTSSNIWGKTAAAYNAFIKSQNGSAPPLPWNAETCPTNYQITHPQKLRELINKEK